MSEPDAARQLARACADHMWTKDRASRRLGMGLETITPGGAVLTMTVTDAMLGPGGICNRGLVFALADSAMAYASNTYGKLNLAQSCDIAYDADVGVGTRLVATAHERRRSGRKGMYDVRVATSDGVTVAEFRGQTIALGDIFTDADPR
jgi:acyl-CoA thioesterase